MDAPSGLTILLPEVPTEADVEVEVAEVEDEDSVVTGAVVVVDAADLAATGADEAALVAEEADAVEDEDVVRREEAEPGQVALPSSKETR